MVELELSLSSRNEPIFVDPTFLLLRIGVIVIGSISISLGIISDVESTDLGVFSDSALVITPESLELDISPDPELLDIELLDKPSDADFDADWSDPLDPLDELEAPEFELEDPDRLLEMLLIPSDRLFEALSITELGFDKLLDTLETIDPDADEFDPLEEFEAPEFELDDPEIGFDRLFDALSITELGFDKLLDTLSMMELDMLF